ncbi:MAG: hypothetical protein ISS16_03290 [Ignavibacteria bacterium]|nr:hypothetical protein [Ignavibacteria bacterium]
MEKKQIPLDTCEPFAYSLLRDSLCMAEYVVESGLKLPTDAGRELSNISTDLMNAKNENQDKKIISEIIEKNSEKLTHIYQAFADIVAPATPLTIRFTTPTDRMFIWLGSKCVPIIRNMLIMSLIFLLGFIITSIGLIKNVTWETNLNLFFSAGLGAYFYSLYTANWYIVNRTFNPKYTTFYNNRIIIGIISGFILASIIKVSALPNDGNTVIKFTPSIIALLGGFSADAVVKILNRIVAVLVALVRGDTKDIIESKMQEMKSKSEAKIYKDKINLAKELVENMTDLKKKDKVTYEKMKEQIDKFLGAAV